MFSRTHSAALAALAVTTGFSGIALGGQYDPYRGIHRDVLVGDPMANERIEPVIANGDFGVSFVDIDGDPAGLAAGVRVYATPVRTTPRASGPLPIGFEHDLPIGGALELDTTFDGGEGSMGIAPTPGAMALLGIGGLGFVGRRGG